MRKQLRCCALVAGCLAVSASISFAQGSEESRSVSPQGLSLSAEVFCSETKLRTASVRVKWGLTPAASDAIKTASLASAKQTLDTTVYAQGFEKGLYASLSIPTGGVVRDAVAATVVATQATPARETPRAFQIRLVETRTASPGVSDAVNGGLEAVVEDLEPGVNYTWRLTIEAGAGKLVSSPLTIQAPVCPADMIEPKVPPKKPPVKP